MSAGGESGQGPVPAVVCPGCGAQVPAGSFCGRCGAQLSAEPGQGSQWLRVGTFAAAPRESVLRPAITSSLFPLLARRARRPFGAGLLLVLIGLLGFALMKVPPAVITLSAFGIPLLFLLYLREADVYRDMNRYTLVAVTGLGAGLGVGWMLLTGGIFARSQGAQLGADITMGTVLREGIALPIGAALLAVAPAVLVRVRAPVRRESLDGFVIGALAALAFTTGATMTRLAPILATGPIAHPRPLTGVIAQACIGGLAVPLTAAAAGGLIGTVLWFAGPKTDAHGHTRARLIVLAVAMVALQGCLGVIDILGLPQSTVLFLHVALAFVALLTLRFGVQVALLHETHDPICQHEPLLCVRCERVVPDMAFCPACGAATRASSRSSREARRRSRPVPVSTQPLGGAASLISKPEPDAEPYPGYALPPGPYLAPMPGRPQWGRPLGVWAAVIGVVTAGLVGVSVLVTQKPARYECPPECGRPTAGPPAMALPRFTAPDGAFSVSYPTPGSAYEVTTGTDGVTARFIAGDGGTMKLFARAANGRSAREIAEGLIAATFPDASTAYEIPNAVVGYQPGYGVVADSWPPGANADYVPTRIVMLVAVKNDVALVASATGPYHEFGPDFGPGMPSGANLQLAQDLGRYVNSFSWKGDPPR